MKKANGWYVIFLLYNCVWASTLAGSLRQVTWVAACWGTSPERSIDHMSRWGICIIFMCSIIIASFRKLTFELTIQRGEVNDIRFWKDPLEILDLSLYPYHAYFQQIAYAVFKVAKLCLV